MAIGMRAGYSKKRPPVIRSINLLTNLSLARQIKCHRAGVRLPEYCRRNIQLIELSTAQIHQHSFHAAGAYWILHRSGAHGANRSPTRIPRIPTGISCTRAGVAPLIFMGGSVRAVSCADSVWWGRALRSIGVSHRQREISRRAVLSQFIETVQFRASDPIA
jgi:hypothetical protein